MDARWWVMVGVVMLGTLAVMLARRFLLPARARSVGVAPRRVLVGDILDEEMNAPLLDGYLNALARPLGAADAMGVRRWGEGRTALSKVDPSQVLSLRNALPRFLRVAYEIEDPWRAYTTESRTYMENDGLQKMARFMEEVWQTDERRHAAVFRASYLKLTGLDDVTPNPMTVEQVGTGEGAFERHLYQRLLAELSASSAYSVFAMHACGPLHLSLRNVAGDEFRHLAVFWAALKWRFGDVMPIRLAKAARWGLALGLEQQNRSGADAVGLEDAIMTAEIGAAMAASTLRLLWWDRTLTAGRLREVFGPPPRVSTSTMVDLSA